MGAVFLAETETDPSRTVALKILQRDVVVREKELRRFLREGEIATQLQHPNIRPVYFLREWEGTHYIEMEYIEGARLRYQLRKQEKSQWDLSTNSLQSIHDEEIGYSLPETLGMFSQISDALHYAHENGIVHRDVKPSNIVVRTDGQPFLLDFGLAREIGAETSLTSTSAVMGTPHYMSPEQITGRSGEIDHRTDIYSLGVTLFESLTGVPPFVGKNYGELFSKIVNHEPRALRDLDPSLPRGLDTVVRRALEKKREDRYSSASEMSRDLRRLAEGMKPSAGAVGVGVRRGIRKVRRQTLKITGIVVLVLAVLSATLFLVYRGTARDKLHSQHEVLLQKAQMAFDSGRADEAKQYVQEANRLLPDSPLGHILLAGGYASTGLYPKAKDELELAVEKGSPTDKQSLRNPVEYLYYGIYLFTQQDDSVLPEAEEYLARAVRDDPDLRSAYFPLYHVRKSLGDFERARSTLEAYRDSFLPPASASYQLVQGLIEELNGNFDEAIPLIRGLADRSDVEPSSMRMDRTLGRLYMQIATNHRRRKENSSAKENFHLAEIHLEKAVEDFPRDFDSWKNLAEIFIVYSSDAESFDEKIALLEQAREFAETGKSRNATRLSDHKLLAEIYTRRVISWFTKAMKDPPEEVWSESIRSCEVLRSIEGGKNWADLYESHLFYQRGLHYQNQDMSRASGEYEKALAINPEKMVARFWLGENLWFSGKYVEALAQLEEARAIWDRAREAEDKPDSWVGVPDHRGWLHKIYIWSFGAAVQIGELEKALEAKAAMMREVDHWSDSEDIEMLNFADFLSLSCNLPEARDCELALKIIRDRKLDEVYANDLTALAYVTRIRQSCQ